MKRRSTCKKTNLSKPTRNNAANPSPAMTAATWPFLLALLAATAASATSRRIDTIAATPLPTPPPPHGRFYLNPLGLIVGLVLGVPCSFMLWSCTIKLLSWWSSTISADETTGLVGGLATAAAITTLFSPAISDPGELSFLEDPGEDVNGLEFVGHGGCGEVYKAELPVCNLIVAIKKIKLPAIDNPRIFPEKVAADGGMAEDRMIQIVSEVSTVGRIRHASLLQLLAHVSRPDCHFLVYEFMRNGSLHDALDSASRGSGRLLRWPERFKVAAGVAAGLEYLHFQHRPRIIHRDLKPANILLDGELNARIADFGLAKAVPDGASRVASSRVAGTAGYIAPEYVRKLSCTDKCDVYSFGVIMAVLVTGMFPSDGFVDNAGEDDDETVTSGIVRWMRAAAKSGDAAATVDQRLLGSGFEAQMMVVLGIACVCTSDDPRERPSSKEVRSMLSQIIH